MLQAAKILVPFDYSKYSEAALSKAIAIADPTRTELHLLHVLGDVSDEEKLEALHRLQGALDPSIELESNIKRSVARGEPSRVILQQALEEEFDLIVMGTHGRTGLSRLAMGSVAERVLRSASCPVLVVRHPDDQINLVDSAAEVLQELNGDKLPGNREEARAAMIRELVRRLKVSEDRSEHLLAALEKREVLTWSNEEKPDQLWQVDLETLGQRTPKVRDTRELIESEDESMPAIDLIGRALQVRATDIHLDPVEDNQYVARFRIDGQLQRYCHLDSEIAETLIRQFLNLGQLDITDTHRPKEGRLRLPSTMSDVEVRATVARVAGGEAASLRLFVREDVLRPLEKIGLSERALADVQQMLHRGEGMILVTGPTGSGKTTSVYAMLQILSQPARNVVSIEDPVELSAPFVRQMEIDPQHGVTLASGLRVLLRMDPDVIAIGEIRDPETASIGMRAASSGKYVLSTLHTRNVVGTVTALRDLNIDNHSLAANVVGIVSQRLIRRLCDCSEQRPLSEKGRQLFEHHNLPVPKHVHVPTGCDRCHRTGYHDRIGVFETLLLNAEVKKAISEGRSEHELSKIIYSSQVERLTVDALRKVHDGVTSLNEALELRWS